MAYLTPAHPDAFVDWPTPGKPPRYLTVPVACPVCKGHGGWNLQVNAFPLHDRPDTPETRHRFRHFCTHCDQCHGSGFVEAGSCVHQWRFVEQLGPCLRQEQCSHCGNKRQVDSSG